MSFDSYSFGSRLRRFTRDRIYERNSKESVPLVDSNIDERSITVSRLHSKYNLNTQDGRKP